MAMGYENRFGTAAVLHLLRRQRQSGDLDVSASDGRSSAQRFTVWCTFA